MWNTPAGGLGTIWKAGYLDIWTSGYLDIKDAESHQNLGLPFSALINYLTWACLVAKRIPVQSHYQESGEAGFHLTTIADQANVGFACKFSLYFALLEQGAAVGEELRAPLLQQEPSSLGTASK